MAQNNEQNITNQIDNQQNTPQNQQRLHDAEHNLQPQNESRLNQDKPISNHEIDNQSNKPLPSVTDPVLQQPATTNQIINHQNIVDIDNKSTHSCTQNHQQTKQQNVEQKQALSEPDQNVDGNKQIQNQSQLSLVGIQRQEQPVVQFEQTPRIPSHRSILDEATEPIFKQTIPEVDQETLQQPPQNHILRPQQASQNIKRTLITYKQQNTKTTPNNQRLNSQQQIQFDESKYFKMQMRKSKQRQLQQIKRMKKQFDDSTPFSKKLLISAVSSTLVSGITAIATKNRSISALFGLTTFALSFIVQK